MHRIGFKESIEDALKWDGGEVRRMRGIAGGPNELLSSKQPTRWETFPKLIIEHIATYNFEIDDEWILGVGNE